MANPTPAAIELIQSEVLNWERPDAEIVAELNAPTIANPEPAQQVPIRLSAQMLLVALQPVEVKGLMPVWNSIRDDINAQDREAVAGWAYASHMAEVLSEQSRNAVLMKLQETQPDPTWRSQLSWAEVNLGRLVDEGDVAAARPVAEVTPVEEDD